MQNNVCHYSDLQRNHWLWKHTINEASLGSRVEWKLGASSHFQEFRKLGLVGWYWYGKWQHRLEPDQFQFYCTMYSGVLDLQSLAKVMGQNKQNKQGGGHHPLFCSPLPCSTLQQHIGVLKLQHRSRERGLSPCTFVEDCTYSTVLYSVGAMKGWGSAHLSLWLQYMYSTLLLRVLNIFPSLLLLVEGYLTNQYYCIVGCKTLDGTCQYILYSTNYKCCLVLRMKQISPNLGAHSACNLQYVK